MLDADAINVAAVAYNAKAKRLGKTDRIDFEVNTFAPSPDLVWSVRETSDDGREHETRGFENASEAVAYINGRERDLA